MRVRAGFISLLAGSTLAISCLSAPTAGAAAARPRSWHVSYRQAGFTVTGVTADGPDNAWAYGYTKSSGLLLHWNGENWSAVRYPTQLHLGYIITAAFVLSPADVWFSGENEVQPLDGKILHLDHGTWSWLPVPSDTNSPVVDVLTDTSIWTVGGQSPGCAAGSNLSGPGCTPVSHWNGSSWQTYPLRAADVGLGIRFAGNARTGIWAAGNSYVSHLDSSKETSVEYAFRWTGSVWQRAAPAGVRSRASTPLVVDARSSVYLPEPTKGAPKSCADHWNGTTWRPLSLPGSGTCRGAVTDDRSGFWAVLGPGEFHGRVITGFAFLHWTGKRYTVTPTYVPNKNGWNTDGFFITAVPRSSRVWVYGDWCPVAKVCKNQGVIATLS